MSNFKISELSNIAHIGLWLQSMKYTRDKIRSIPQASEFSSIRELNSTRNNTSNHLFESYNEPSWNNKDLESQNNLSFYPPPQPTRTPLLRNPNNLPPSTRFGATTTRSSSNTERKLFHRTDNSWWTRTAKAMTCCLWPYIWIRKIEGAETRQAWREKVSLSF